MALRSVLSAPLGIGLVAVLAAFGLAAASAAADVPLPDQDPFYAVPGNIAHLPGGTVLKSRAVATYAGNVLPLPTTAWQVQYKSLGPTGMATADVATILVPTAPWHGPGLRPLISDQSAEDGVGTKCSPSYALRGGSQDSGSNSESETGVILQALEQGWAVVAPDYEGPRSEFLGVAGQADGVLDGIRAALAFRPDHLGARTPIGMWGYSGGSVATIEAALAQRNYAPELHFAGIGLGGLVADLRATTQAFASAGAGGAIIVGLIGQNRSYPARHITRYLSAAAIHDMANSQSDCVGDAIGKYPNLQISQIEAYPGAFDSPAAVALQHLISPQWLPGTPTAPIYDYHATGDEFAPIGPERQLMHRFCNAGIPVEHVEDPGEHLSEAAAGVPGLINYFTSRFSGHAAPSDCATIPAGTGPLNPPASTPPPRASHQGSHPRPGCPRPTGRLRGTTLGLVTLGMSRAQARRAYKHSSTRGRRYTDFFCLTPNGVRVGYASPKLLDTLSPRLRRRLRGRVVWASTADDFYSLRGIRPGASIAAAARKLHIGAPFHIGLNYWYLAPGGSSTAVLKVRGRIVEEIGIADRQLTNGRQAQSVFVTSFS